MKDCNFYKNKGRIFCDWIKTSSAEDCVQATVPGMRGGRGTLRGGGHNALHCCHFFRDRTMIVFFRASMGLP